jgi:hypothetical protein
MRGEFETQDYFLACLLVYEGVRCVRATAGFNNEYTWLFRCPEHDFEAVKEDFANKEWCVNMSAFIEAIKIVDSLKKKAKQCHGVYTSDDYAKVGV